VKGPFAPIEKRVEVAFVAIAGVVVVEVVMTVMMITTVVSPSIVVPIRRRYVVIEHRPQIIFDNHIGRRVVCPYKFCHDVWIWTIERLAGKDGGSYKID